jgi:hypothetical protein
MRTTALRDLGRLAVLEIRLYVVLLRWCARRRDVPPTARAWPYAALSAPLLWLWIFGSAVELVVFHVIIPWDRIRVVVDIISAWGLVWMLGTLAAYRIRPHLLFRDQLRVRNSVYHDICVPTDAIVSAVAREAELPSAMRSLQITEEAGTRHVSVAVSGRTNVVLALKPGTALQTAKGTLPADTVRLWVDDPRALVAHLNGRLAAAAEGMDAR